MRDKAKHSSFFFQILISIRDLLNNILTYVTTKSQSLSFNLLETLHGYVIGSANNLTKEISLTESFFIIQLDYHM